MVMESNAAHAEFALMSKAGWRQMQPRERGPDFKACRDDAGERTGEGSDLDGTTLRRVLMFQYEFLSRFVALAVDQPAMPISDEVKGATLDLTPAGNVG